MSADIPRRVEDIFEAASELPPNERHAFLRETCGADDDVRARVESLLAAAGQAPDYFSGLADRLGLTTLYEGDLELPPDKTIGAYRLRHLLGRGGMGAVYLADRADEQFEKQVALKILPIGIGGPELRRRFMAERQILARLTHPNIAGLLDGGLTEDSTPYFVLEYVDGVVIDESCDQQRLDVDQRLDLFLQVCDAVAYAHRNLVVHRDLKPGNVLVDPAGQVKLLDFGIAKVLDPNSTDAPETRIGVRPMTPRYTSPELIRGEPVTTAADIYSLGVLLYELLTGLSPYAGRPTTEAEIRRVVCEQDVASPSRRVLQEADGYPSVEERARRRRTTPARLHQRLAGDLDTIVAMTLRKDPEQRYRSVEQLAADLRRYQQDLPVLAQAPTLRYRASKFVQRHRASVVAACVGVVLILAIVTLGVGYVVTTSRQSRVIALERNNAEQIRDLLLQTFVVSDPNESPGETVTARELLDRGAARIREELAGQPQSQALMMTTIGEVYVGLSLYDEARTQYQQAADLYRELAAEDSKEYAHVVQELAYVEEQSGNYEPAQSLAEEAVSLRTRLNDQAGLADAKILLGRVFQRRGELDAADTHYREALQIQRSVFGSEHEAVADGLTNLGTILQQRGDASGAEDLHREALAIRRKLLGDDNLKLIESLYNLGVVTRKQGRYEEAKGFYEEALAITRRLVPEGHADDAYMLNGLGFVHFDLGEYDQAEARFRESVEISRRFLGDRHPNVGLVLGSVGHVLLERGEPREARPVLEESLDIVTEVIPRHPRVPSLKLDLGRCLRAEGDYPQAEPLLLAAYRSNLDLHGPEDAATQSAVTALVDLYEAWEQPAHAEEFRGLLAGDTKTNSSP